MNAASAHTWQGVELPEVVELLARRQGVRPHVGRRRSPTLQGYAAGDRHVPVLAAEAGLEAEAVDARYDEVEQMLRTAAPALVRVELGADERYLAIVGADARRLTVLAPDRATHRVPLADVRNALCAAVDGPAAESAERLLAAAGLTPDARTRGALLRKQLGGHRVSGVWLLHVPPSAPLRMQLRQRGLLRQLGVLVAGHAAQYALWILAWYVVGLAALRGRYDAGWLWAWVLLLATIVPLRLLVMHRQGAIGVAAGALLKRRLLLGTLRLDADVARSQGAGQFLGRVLESDAVETQAMAGGLNGLVAVVELLGAAVVLALGAGGLVHAGILALWLAVTASLAVDYYRQQRAWAATRLAMTHALIEQMVGHRTRLAQHPQGEWHAAEDREIERYLDASRRMDRSAARLVAVVPRSWLVVAVTVVGHAFVSGATTAALAVGLGGTLLAYQAFRRLTFGLVNLTGAAVAWAQIAPLVHAAAEGDEADAGLPDAADAPGEPAGAVRPGETLLEARGLTFGYGESTKAVLEQASVHIRGGDRLLLEGPSGGGKSTLAALLAGLRRPHSGLLLLRGLDRRTLGTAAWRRRVASAPQFHDNHVLVGTFAFNLLLGRAWPPSRADLEEAESLCRALGLGPLVDRMPAGLHQMVGETGWQLSHGERSRLFLARALLQRADLVLLDESFGALDPENMARSLRCVLERSPTLLVIAHP